ARFGRERIAYSALNARANRIARLLMRQGAGPESRVAVCLERSFEMLAALLGTLKAGAAYVPVGSEYPREGIALLLGDSGASHILTDERIAGKLPESTARAIRLDLEAAAIEREDPDDPEGPVHPDGLAYIIYTSGSTGRPKGVAMSHRAISN